MFLALRSRKKNQLRRARMGCRSIYSMNDIHSFLCFRYALQPDPVNHSQVITDQAASARVKYVYLSAVYVRQNSFRDVKRF